jgi:Tfp pilus assembly protein PilO
MGLTMHDKVKQSLKVVHWVAAAVITLLLAGTVAFGVLPLRQRGNDDIKAANSLRGSLDRFEQLRLANARADVQIQEAQRRLDEAEKRLASGPPDSAFNRELTQVAKAAGIRIENMPPVGAPKDAGAYKSVQVTVVGSGDWESCYKFLSGLRSMDRVVRLDSVILDVQDKDGRAHAAVHVNCQLTVKFSTFFMER